MVTPSTSTTPDLGAQGEPVAWGRYTVLSADHRRRIQALGAAISLRDWFGVEKAHAEIRDAFDRPDIYDPTSTDNLRSRNSPAAWAYEYLASDGWQRALWWECPSELPQYKSRPERCRNVRPLYEAPAAPRTGSGVSVEEIAQAVWLFRWGSIPDATFSEAKKIARSIPDGAAARSVSEVYAFAEKLFALFAQALRDGGES